MNNACPSGEPERFPVLAELSEVLRRMTSSTHEMSMRIVRVGFTEGWERNGKEASPNGSWILTYRRYRRHAREPPSALELGWVSSV